MNQLIPANFLKLLPKDLMGSTNLGMNISIHGVVYITTGDETGYWMLFTIRGEEHKVSINKPTYDFARSLFELINNTEWDVTTQDDHLFLE